MGIVKRHPILAALWAVVILIGLGARVHRLGDRSLWEDELSTWNSTRGSVMDGIRYVQMPHPPLYSLCCRMVGGGPTPSEARLRLPAAIFGTFAAVAGGALAGACFGRRVGTAALMCLMVNAFLVRYSREARMYSLLVLTSTLSMLFAYRLVTQARRRDLAGYGVSTVLMLYTHYFASLVLIAQALWIIATALIARRRAAVRRAQDADAATNGARNWMDAPWRSPGVRRWALGATASVLLFAPLGAFFVLRILPNKLGWIQPAPAWRYVAALGDFVAVWPGGDPNAGDAERPSSLLVGTVVVLGASASVLRVRVGRRTKTGGAPPARNSLRTEDHTTPVLLLCTWLLCVLGGLGLLSAVSSPVFVPRYAISAMVPATILILELANRVGARVLYVVAAALVAINATALARERSQEPLSPNGLKAIIGFLRREATPQDAVVLVDFPFCPNWKNPVSMGFEYYGWRDDIALVCVRGDQRSGRLIEDAALDDPRTLHLVTLLGDLDEALARHHRAWQTLVLRPYRLVQVEGANGSRSSAWLDERTAVARMGLREP